MDSNSIPPTSLAVAIAAIAATQIGRGLDGIPMFKRLGSPLGLLAGFGLLIVSETILKWPVWTMILTAVAGVFLAFLALDAAYHLLARFKIPQYYATNFTKVMVSYNKVGLVLGALGTAFLVLREFLGYKASITTYQILVICWLVLTLVALWERTRMAAFGGGIGSGSRSVRQTTLVADAVDHVLIEGRFLTTLSILNDRPEKPAQYPIRVRNTRPVPLEIIGYSVSLKWDSKVVQQVEWRGPSRATSNGIAAAPPYDNSQPLPAIVVRADDCTYLHIPLNPQPLGSFPNESPKWGATGTLTVRAEGKTRELGFDLESDNYQLTPHEWSAWRISL